MKFRKYVVLLGFASLALSSCSDDDNDNVTVTDEAITQAFQQKYPGVAVTEWELEYGLYKAEFLNEGRSAEAWFQPDGTWVKTDTDWAYADVPAEVKAYVSEHHPTLAVDDVDWIETPDGSYFLIELDAKGGDIYLQLLPDGSLLI
ncbi:MAG: PepSY-like domain-containing protein [Bacteroidaceae bacterium]|nr:PepSY-like domain-containing protein [Bacteroidaceae bacterium]